MSIAVLVQVHEEVRRLAIAGGAVASGDFRLKKLVPPLEQAGAKAPVFGRVAQAVVESNEKTASAALLELATLVNAILYTQGETGAAGEFKALETTDLGARETQAGARVLKPLLDALSSTGSGRIELVRDAVERGTFKDLRLVKPALNALDDPYPEIGQLIAERVLPMYSKAVVPELKAKLDLKGRGGHLHRLRLLHKLDPDGTRETIRKALDEGSKEIRVVAIECLGTTGEDLGYLLEQVKAKAKDVRAAALGALSAAKASVADVIGALKRAIDGEDLELIIDRLKQSTQPEIQEYVLSQAERQLGATLAEKDAKKQGPAITRLQHLTLSLEGRTDAKTEAFLLRCFDSVSAFTKIKSTPSGQDFNELLARVMAQGTPKLRQKLAATHATLTGEMLPPAYAAAREIMSPAEYFKEASPILAGLSAKRGKKGAEHERAMALASVLEPRGNWYGLRSWYGVVDPSSDGKSSQRELDPRWLDTAVEVGSLELVCALARPGHAKANKFLAEQLAGTKPHEEHGILQTMVRIQHPDAADAIITALKKQAKSSYSGYYGYWFGQLIAELPGSAYPKFEALLPTLPEKVVDQLIESVQTLKNKAE